MQVTEINGMPCPSCPTADVPKEEVLPGDQITIEAYISNWGGVSKDNRLEFYVWTIDTVALSGNGSGLSLASFVCSDDLDCRHGFDNSSQCTCASSQCSSSGMCDINASAFVDIERPDYPIEFSFVRMLSTDILFEGLTLNPVVDEGNPLYVGTLILDVSLDARGVLDVSMVDDLRKTYAGVFDRVQLNHRTLNSVTINLCDIIDSPNDCNGNSIPDECEADGDGDGVIDACDPCPLDAADDSDGDGVCDSDDGCPTNPLKIVPGDCGCNNPEDDSDVDGVSDCVDLCAGVDDAIFGEQCASAIPTVDSWGLVVLTLLLMVGGKVYFQRSPVVSC